MNTQQKIYMIAKAYLQTCEAEEAESEAKYIRDHVAVWDDNRHPCVTDDQWEQMLRGESVEDEEGFVYIIDDEPVERW